MRAQRGELQEGGADVDRHHPVEELGGDVLDGGDVGVAGVEPQPVQSSTRFADLTCEGLAGFWVCCIWSDNSRSHQQ